MSLLSIIYNFKETIYYLNLLKSTFCFILA